MDNSLVAQYWNKVDRKNWPLKPRRHARASEIGSPFADRYCAMNGVSPSNPWNERTLRIFDAGRMIEFLLTRTLRLAGLLKNAQEWVELPETEEHIGIKGYLDVVIGGEVDWARAKQDILDTLGLYGMKLSDEVLEFKAMQIIEGLSARFPDGLGKDYIVEIKSTSSMTYAAKDKFDADGIFSGYTTHKLQLFAYLEMLSLDQGFLFYIFKDDMSLAEVPVSRDDPVLRNAFYTDLSTMKGFLDRKELPPLEDLITFNTYTGRFGSNWSVANSRYLSLLYGFETPEAYEESIKAEVADINYALEGLRNGQSLWVDAYADVISAYNLDKYI